MTKVMETLRNHPRVEIVDDERRSGNGVIVTLKRSWTFDPVCDNRVSGEDSPSAALSAVRAAHPFAGPFEG